MFKAITLLGLACSGIGYGYYSQYQDYASCLGIVPQTSSSGVRCLHRQDSLPPCCANPCAGCARGCDNCCDDCGVCCGGSEAIAARGRSSVPVTCCEVKAAVQTAPCCAVPCADGGAACEECVSCAIDCEACCSNAVMAVSGSAAAMGRK